MRETDAKIAEKFNIKNQCKKLEMELLQINELTEIHFDLNGFLDNMNQIIILTKYDIPYNTKDYFKARKELLKNIIQVANNNGLTRTEDNIEDYGLYYYFVFKCDDTWKNI